VRCFCLPGANDETFDKLRYFLAAYPRIVEIVQSQTPPYLFKIHKTGQFDQVAL
jgi:hypothetical protein